MNTANLYDTYLLLCVQCYTTDDRQRNCPKLVEFYFKNKHCNINQKDEGTYDDLGRDGGTNFILRIKEQEACLTLQEHDDDDDDMFFKSIIFLTPTCYNITSIL